MSDPTQDPIPPQQPPPVYIPSPTATASGLPDNIAAALAYVTIIPAIIFLVLEPYNRIPLVRFHSFQSIGFCILAFVLQVVIMVAEELLRFIPGTWALFSILRLLLGVGLLIAWLVVVLKASKGEWYKLPIIGDFAEKQARS